MTYKHLERIRKKTTFTKTEFAKELGRKYQTYWCCSSGVRKVSNTVARTADLIKKFYDNWKKI